MGENGRGLFSLLSFVFSDFETKISLVEVPARVIGSVLIFAFHLGVDIP